TARVARTSSSLYARIRARPRSCSSPLAAWASRYQPSEASPPASGSRHRKPATGPTILSPDREVETNCEVTASCTSTHRCEETNPRTSPTDGTPSTVATVPPGPNRVADESIHAFSADREKQYA